MSLRGSLVAACLTALFFVGLRCAAAAQADEEAKDDSGRICAPAEVLPLVRGYPQVRKMLEELPPDHRVKPEIEHQWSDDEQERIPRLVSVTPVNAEGKADGEAYYFGAELRVVPYKNGVKDGVEKRYWVPGHGEKGRLVAEIPWKEGHIHGVKRIYHRANGKLQMEVPYKDGRRQGIAKTYDLPGRLVKVTPYVDDRMHGQAVDYYPGTEQEKKVIPFRRGKVHGVVREDYEDGTPKRELPARDDVFHGIEKQYDEKGELVLTRYWLEDDIVSKEEYLEAEKAEGER